MWLMSLPLIFCSKISKKGNTMALSKHTLEYWRTRLCKRKFSRGNGETYEGAEYFVYLSIDGRQIRFNLNSSNKEVAADRALGIWCFYQANGGEATIEKFKPSVNRNRENPTVGEFLKEVEELRIFNPRTFHSYKQKFRRVVVGVFNLPAPNSRKNHRTGGYQKWTDKVDSIKLSRLTPLKIMEWRAKYLRQRDADPKTQRSARITVASNIRNSKALFKQECLDLLPFKNLNNPFEGVKPGATSTRRYRSETNFDELIQDALKELHRIQIPEIDPERHYQTKIDRNKALSKKEQFKILILGLGAGLRRAEIDMLEWSRVDYERHQIIVEETQYGVVKTESSERVIDIHESITAFLQECQETTPGSFVIHSCRKPRPDATYKHYRCDHHFKGLIQWMRSKGVTRNDPIHTLRKEFGSKMCDAYGIHAASEALGHKSIAITRASYLEKRGRRVVGVF